MKFIDEKIIRYCYKYSNPDSKILKELHEYTFDNEYPDSNGFPKR